VKVRRFGGRVTARDQRGFALIAVLALAAMITAYLITIGINRSKAELSNEREERNIAALRQAKAALITYAASEQWQLYKSPASPSKQPGGLPCPDLLNNGSSAGICSGAGGNRVGRLPYVTIGSDDLRDASGERLWYAVSSNFYRNFGNNVINSDTQGLLTVTGSAPASNVVAIVFAPGPPAQDSSTGLIQDRGGANVTNTPSYLEGFATTGSDYTYASSAPPPAPFTATSTFNDRLLVITQAELMAAVEPVVAARIERTVKPILNTYKAQWQAFPFPARFDNPHPGSSGNGSSRSPMTYLGDTSQTSGLLPVAYVTISAASNASPIVVTTDSAHALSTGKTVWISDVAGNIAANGKWTVTVVDSTHFQLNGSAGSGSYTPSGIVTPSYPLSNLSVSQIGGGGQIVGALCSTVTMPPGMQCNFSATDDNCGPNNCIFNLRFSISAKVGAAGLSFATLPALSGVQKTVVGSSGTVSSESITGSLDVLGDGTLTYTATLPSDINCTVPPGCSSHNVTISIPDVLVNDALKASDPNVGWFVANEWYRQTYYTVAGDLLPGRGGSCGVTLPCLTVNNFPPVNNNKQALLILTGRALNGTGRPSANLNNYLEGANPTAPPTYEHRPGNPTSINDRVVVVAP